MGSSLDGAASREVWWRQRECGEGAPVPVVESRGQKAGRGGQVLPASTAALTGDCAWPPSSPPTGPAMHRLAARVRTQAAAVLPREPWPAPTHVTLDLRPSRKLWKAARQQGSTCLRGHCLPTHGSMTFADAEGGQSSQWQSWDRSRPRVRPRPDPDFQCKLFAPQRSVQAQGGLRVSPRPQGHTPRRPSCVRLTPAGPPQGAGCPCLEAGCPHTCTPHPMLGWELPRGLRLLTGRNPGYLEPRDVPSPVSPVHWCLSWAFSMRPQLPCHPQACLPAAPPCTLTPLSACLMLSHPAAHVCKPHHPASWWKRPSLAWH